MKMKRTLALCLTLAICAGLAISGTLAYLQDTDSDVNVMTLGSVKIEQLENGLAEGGFQDGTPLMPGVYETLEETGDWTAANVVEKRVTVKNIGRSPAYVRTLIAAPKCDVTTPDGAENAVLLNFNDQGMWDISLLNDIVVDGKPYELYVAYYNGELPAGETTEANLEQVLMSKYATNETVEAIQDENGEVKVYVISQAMQINGFEGMAIAEVLDEGFNGGIALASCLDDYLPAWFGDADAENNGPTVDGWDGTADTTWYNDTDTEFVIMTAEELAGFADLVDAGNTFEGKTVKLGQNLDLYCEDENGNRVSFDPIGYGYDIVFKGTFDGQGHVISSLYQNGWDLGLSYGTQGGGLFASVVDATIKNLIIRNAEIVMECVDMGALVGYSYGNSTYENISIEGSTVANYNRYTGGVVGEVNGTQTFKNVDVDAGTVVSALWGTYDAALGGIVGGKWGEATLSFEDCDVSAKLDAFNDACSNYQYYLYRLCGMLIGMSEEVTDGTASASYLTATNCTVRYGDWVNYTYCEFESNGRGSYAAPDEWKHSRVQEGYATGGVDPNHEHDTDESHEALIAFNQLFGGDKGVRGGTTHEGVTVFYN